MLSRRSFLKIAGLGTIAMGSGFGIGSLVSKQGNGNLISMCGFIPSERALVENVFETFSKHINPESISSVNVYGNNLLAPVVKNAISGNTKNMLFGGTQVNINIMRIDGKRSGDIMLMNNHLVLSPENDFDRILSGLRSKLKESEAEYFFTADIAGKTKGRNVLVIENEKGIADEIELSRKKSEITVAGNCGNMKIVAGENTAYVKEASCRNKLCKHSGFIGTSNPLIACAPNKIVLRLA